MSKPYGQHEKDKYIEKVANGRYRLHYKSGGHIYQTNLTDARSYAQATWQYKEIKPKTKAPVVTPTKVKKADLPKSVKSKKFPLEVRHGGKVYYIEDNIDIRFVDDNEIYICHAD